MSAPFKQAVVLDYETAWGRAVKLGFSCQTNEEYIRDPRFKAWGLSWKWLGSEDAPVWVTHKDLPAFFASIDWSITAVVAQNAQFDVSIMSWIFWRCVPRRRWLGFTHAGLSQECITT